MKEALKHSPMFLRKRRFWMGLPVLIVACLGFVFYRFGGGKGIDGKKDSTGKGFNTSIPNAHFDSTKKPLDKMGFYDKAQADSEKYRQQARLDPYHSDLPAAGKMAVPFTPGYRPSAGMVPGGAELRGSESSGSLRGSGSLPPAMWEEAGTEAMLRKLAQLREMVARPGGRQDPGNGGVNERLRNLMQGAGRRDTAEDPQMEKLDAMLDKILHIQHPEKKSPPEMVVNREEVLVTLPDNRKEIEPVEGLGPERPAFYSIDQEEGPDTVARNTLPAVCASDQEIVAGVTMAFRLTQESQAGGVPIPANTLVYGQVSFSNERILVHIPSIRVGQGIYPVSLDVCGLDGLVGIPVPTGLSREVAKQSAAEGIGGINGLTVLDPSLGAQAANAGIQTAKTLLSRKIRLVRVQVKAGYRVLLRNSRM